MNRKSILISLIFTGVFTLLFGIAGLTNLFEKIDLRLYDGLLHLKKDPPISEKVVMGIIDEDDIDKLGDWPWTRNILADSIIRMKEFGTKAAVFDIEYISPSLKSVASNAEENIINQIQKNQAETEELMKSIPLALNRGYPASSLGTYTDALIHENLSDNYNELYNYVENNVSFDNDEYFGKAAQFFENTFLTVNNQDLGYSNITQEDIDYIFKRFLTYKVDDPDHLTLRDNDYTFRETYEGIGKGFTPALHSMMQRAHGAGFTNSNVDSDGTRRRMELLYAYGDNYLPQLVFEPLLNILDVQELQRTKKALIMKNALYPGETERKDVKIPLDNHGQMLINWQHEDTSDENRYNGINYEHIYTVNQLDYIEQNLFDNLCIMQQWYVLIKNGYPLDYVVQGAKLVEHYNEILNFKNYLLSHCTGFDEDENPYDGNTDEEYNIYFELRQNFFEELTEFVHADYLAEINDYFTEVHFTDQEFIDDINDLFNTLQSDTDFYNASFAKLKNKFEGAYCIIGMTAASTTDIGAIPFKKQYANVGIHANIMNTILTKSFISYMDWGWGFLVSVIVSLLGILLLGLSNTKQNIINGVAKLVEILFFMILFVAGNIYMPLMCGVVTFNIVDYLGGVLRRYLASSREKKFITQIASSFANKDTVDELRKNPEAFKTEGQKKNITALFSDIQKFSTLSESISKIYGDEGPNKLIEILNEYLGSMSNEILRNNGNIDKYEGDAIISMFGAPDPLNSHTKEEWAYLCLDSAIRMKKVEVEFNQTHSDLFKDYEVTNAEGQKEMIKLNPLQTRIGINSGEAFVGLMGSKTESFSKLNYTMIGDTVNLASRLEGVNKVYSSWIMCSEDTWKLANTGANEGKIIVRPFDRVRVVGRATPVQLYNVLGFADEVDSQKKEELDMFNNALSLYLDRQFAKAEQAFIECSKILQDKTALIFADRCKLYKTKGVPENWDGVMNMTSK
jgi:class 3 adenylate cyclase